MIIHNSLQLLTIHWEHNAPLTPGRQLHVPSISSHCIDSQTPIGLQPHAKKGKNNYITSQDTILINLRLQSWLLALP